MKLIIARRLSGNIKSIDPSRTFSIAVVYAVALMLLAYDLPRYRGGRRSCLRTVRHPDHDASELASHQSTIDYLTEGSIGYKPGSFAESLTVGDTPNSNFYSKVMLFVGTVIGLLVVLGIFLHQIFGESTTFSWLAGYLFLPHATYSEKVFKTIGWEPFSDIGTFLGAFIASIFVSRRFSAFRPIIPPSWRNRFGPSQIKRAFGSFGGSFLMLFGARMAGGCASGHILSGGIQMADSAWLFTFAVLIAMVVTAKMVYGKTASTTYLPAKNSGANSL